MPKAYFMPPDDDGKRLFLSNFSSKLPAQAATVGVTPAEVASTQDDNAYFTFISD